MALVLFALALFGILGTALAVARFAVPPSAFVLAVMGAVLLVATVAGRRRKLAGWMVGSAVALLGLLAGGYSLVMLPAAIAEGDVPIATAARAATAMASICFLIWLAIAWRRGLRRGPPPNPLTPLPWR